jgi:hypothetical protein
MFMTNRTVTTAPSPNAYDQYAESSIAFVNSFVKACVKADYEEIQMFCIGGGIWAPDVLKRAYTLGFIACIRSGAGHVPVIAFLITWWWNDASLTNKFPVVPLEALLEALVPDNDEMIRYLIDNTDPVTCLMLNGMYKRAQSKYHNHLSVVQYWP